MWPNELRDFYEVSMEIEEALTNYNEFRSHSSIDYIPPREFRRKFMDDLDDLAFRERFWKKEIEVTQDEN